MTVSFSGNSFNVTSEDISPREIAFNDDGLKMFMVGSNTATVYEYDLTTPYSLASGVSFSGNSFSVTNEDSSPRGLVFNDDGTKLFMVGTNTDAMYEYDLTTPYSLASGVSYSGNSFSVTNEDSSPQQVVFNDDGSKMFMVGNTTETVFEYTLTTPYSLASGVSYSGFSFNVNSEDETPLGLVFNDDGLKMFMVGLETDSVYEYNLTTPYSLASGVSYLGIVFSVAGQDQAPQGVVFNDDGLKMFMIGFTNETVYEYDLTTPYSLAPGTARPMTGAFSNAVVKDEVLPYLIVKIGTAAGDVNVWSGIGNLVFDSGDGDENYIGVGDFGGISAPEETTELKASGLNFSLSGIPSNIISLALNSMRQGKPGRVWMGLVDVITELTIDSPVEIFSGQTDIVSIDEGSQTSTVNVAAESKLVDLKRKRDRRYTTEDQKRDDPTDLGFDQVPSLQEQEVIFGRARSS